MKTDACTREVTFVDYETACACLSGHPGFKFFKETGRGGSPNATYEVVKPQPSLEELLEASRQRNLARRAAHARKAVRRVRGGNGNTCWE